MTVGRTKVVIRRELSLIPITPALEFESPLVVLDLLSLI